jgi:tripartite ATP-independent transporter DctM subunit
MSVELVSVLLFGGLLILLSFGVPVVFALGGVTVLLTLLLEGYSGLYTVATTTYREITDATLITIPLFLLMGNLLIHSGISDRLFRALNYWFSGIRGSLAVVSVGVCVALAMCGGFGPGILTMGLIAVPAMLKQNYDKSLALGCVMAGGVLGTIIPPSIIMIVFSVIARVSIGRLFFAGAVPGFVCAFFYIIYIITRCYLQPSVAPSAAVDVTWKMRWGSLKDVLFPTLLVVLVLGSIFAGMATPTEAAGVGSMGSLILCIINRRLTWKVLADSCLETFRVSGMALWILIAATLFGIFYTTAGAQSLVMDIVEALPVSRWFILVGMQVILLIFGMFMDDYAVITICTPIFLPIAKLLGFDPIWFSIVFLLNMQVAYLTPPFGWALILMKGVAPQEVSTSDIWRSVPPFVGMQLIVLILTILVPQIALWLPGKMF